MELKDTVEMMVSSDYKERFKAEYFQTKIRLEKLRAIISKIESGTSSFTATCPLYLLKTQVRNMDTYLYTLETRAKYEGIDLEGENV